SLLHLRLKTNYNILKKAKDHTGRSFNVIKVPHPDPDPEPWVADKEKKEFGILPGDSLYWLGARSYMNFVFCNELVLIPAYWEKGKPEALRSEDDEALQIFKQVFPNRKIIPIQLNELKWEGGGMHCRYQSQPKLISSN
ncbi:MAG: agmatine deiminase family protein, partial [Bacteroidota bacterium]